jgi:hypothetical protein
VRLFDLVRDVDVSGKSGTGTVAQGVEFDDGTVAMRWLTPLRSTTLFDDAATLEAIHGHEGLTRVVWRTASWVAPWPPTRNQPG